MPGQIVYTETFLPPELLAAHGFLPTRMHRADDASCGDGPCSGWCTFLRSWLSEAVSDVAPTETLADPMVGPTRVMAEALVVSRIPGVSHCAFDGTMIGNRVRRELNTPVFEIEVPVATDPIRPALGTRLEALIETARSEA